MFDYSMMFDKILFPTDFSESSNKALGFAIEVSQYNQAELVVLYAFRLINGPELSQSINRVDLKREIEKKAILDFKPWDKRLNKVGLDYSFLSEVGFLNDRILSTVQSKNIDLVILCDEVQKKVEEKDGGGRERFIHELQCPVMLIPSNSVLS